MQTVSIFRPKFLLLLFFCICFVQTTAISLEYAHTIKLKKMTFSWKVKENKLYVRLIAPTKGWVGIGFNPSFKMQDANFVLGYVKRGSVNVTDAYGVRPKEHISDTAMSGKNNITDISGSQKGKLTTIEFAMPINSDDKADVKLSLKEYTKVLLAYGKGKDNFRQRHRYRTKLLVNLGTGKYK